MTEVTQRVTDWESVVRGLNKQVSELERKLAAANEIIEQSVRVDTPPTDSTWIKWKKWLREIAKSPHAMSATTRFEAYLSRQNREAGDD